MRSYPLTIDRIVQRVRSSALTTDPKLAEQVLDGLPAASIVVAQNIIRASDRRSAGQPCRRWADHAWNEREIGAGVHALRGTFQRFAMRCAECGTEHVETRWIDIPNIPLPQGAEGAE